MANCVICKRNIQAANAGRRRHHVHAMVSVAVATSRLTSWRLRYWKSPVNRADAPGKRLSIISLGSSKLRTTSRDGWPSLPATTHKPLFSATSRRHHESEQPARQPGRRKRPRLWQICSLIPSGAYWRPSIRPRKRGLYASITLDFSATTLAFPGPMLAVLAACIRLRDEYDVDVSLVRPADTKPAASLRERELGSPGGPPTVRPSRLGIRLPSSPRAASGHRTNSARSWTESSTPCSLLRPNLPVRISRSSSGR